MGYQYSTKRWLDYWFHQIQDWYYESEARDESVKDMMTEIIHLIHASSSERYCFSY